MRISDWSSDVCSSDLAAMKVIEDQPGLAVVLSDQRMPGEAGNEFLAKAREVTDATRVLITGYADLDAVIAAVNDGRSEERSVGKEGVRTVRSRLWAVSVKVIKIQTH